MTCADCGNREPNRHGKNRDEPNRSNVVWTTFCFWQLVAWSMDIIQVAETANRKLMSFCLARISWLVVTRCLIDTSFHPWSCVPCIELIELRDKPTERHDSHDTTRPTRHGMTRRDTIPAVSKSLLVRVYKFLLDRPTCIITRRHIRHDRTTRHCV